jgi:hypothetical protein
MAGNSEIPTNGALNSRLTKMHAKALSCFNFFNFHPVSTKFPINIEHIILTNRMVFVFGTSSSIVFSLLSKLSKSKATGLDKISARLLRECPDLISDSLSINF